MSVIAAATTAVAVVLVLHLLMAGRKVRRERPAPPGGWLEGSGLDVTPAQFWPDQPDIGIEHEVVRGRSPHRSRDPPAISLELGHPPLIVTIFHGLGTDHTVLALIDQTPRFQITKHFSGWFIQTGLGPIEAQAVVQTCLAL